MLVGDKTGTVLRPNLIGGLVGKAAARTEMAADWGSSRRCTDFVVLATLISAPACRGVELGGKDRKRLRAMLLRCREDRAAMLIDHAADALEQLERAAGLTR